MGQASTLREIEERSILIDGDIAAVIEEMKENRFLQIAGSGF